MRSQHCYTTAYGFMHKYPKNVIRLIRYCINTFQNDLIAQMRAYQSLGAIYEHCKQYTKESFESALSAIPDDKKDDYIPYLLFHY